MKDESLLLVFGCMLLECLRIRRLFSAFPTNFLYELQGNVGWKFRENLADFSCVKCGCINGVGFI